VALIGHLQVAQKIGAASATPTAASSGSLPKAPGSAGGYLLDNGELGAFRLGGKLLRISAEEARAFEVRMNTRVAGTESEQKL
jgi:hypothetical protein